MTSLNVLVSTNAVLKDLLTIVINVYDTYVV